MCDLNYVSLKLIEVKVRNELSGLLQLLIQIDFNENTILIYPKFLKVTKFKI